MKILGFLVTMLTLVVLLFTFFAIKNLNETKERMLWPKIDATIVNSEIITGIPRKNRSTSYTLAIEYLYYINNVHYTGHSDCYHGSYSYNYGFTPPKMPHDEIAHCDIGKIITVFYDPKNPKKSTINNFGPSILLDGYNTFGIILIFLLASATLISIGSTFPRWGNIAVLFYAIFIIGGCSFTASIHL